MIPAEARPSPLERGIEAAHAGRFRAAAGWFDESIAREESVEAALHNRAIVRAAQGRYDDAIRDGLDAVAHNDRPITRLALAGIQLRAGLPDAALTTLEPVGDEVPAAAVLRALSHALAGDAELAASMLRAALETSELGASDLNNLGILAEQVGDATAAEDLYNRAIGSDPDGYHAWRNLGMLLMREGDAANAERALRRYLELAPDSVSDRGVIQGRADRLGE